MILKKKGEIGRKSGREREKWKEKYREILR